ncbi:MAG: metalloregulator ArsR/SmtB family transcription factor [Puia sp.]|nr:metalloregulator ArsR/SmtB family transcription factor [Puia sp.]
MRRDVFQAIADPTRRAILSLLAFNAMTPNAIAEHFDSSRQAISKHIKILAECQLLNQEQTGREIYYHFNPQKMQEVDQWVAQFREQWEKRFDQLDALLKKQKNK